MLGLLLAPAQASAAKRPYVYIFSLDGLDRDAVLDEGSAPFLTSVIDDEAGSRSTLFPRSRSVMVAETNPNHSSMITGAPTRAGTGSSATSSPPTRGRGTSRAAQPGRRPAPSLA